MPGKKEGWGLSWVMVCAALGLHVLDEALTDFLSVYNPTVLELRGRFPWFPLPLFEFREWLIGLIVLDFILLLLSYFAFRGSQWMRPVGYALAVIMFANGAGHILGTIFGRTVQLVQFERPMPGFYTSPLLLASSAFLWVQLKRTRR